MEAQKKQPGAELEAAVDEAIAACDGDLRAAIRALLVANDLLVEQNNVLSAELDSAWQLVSPGYTRSSHKRRTKAGDPN